MNYLKPIISLIITILFLSQKVFSQIRDSSIEHQLIQCTVFISGKEKESDTLFTRGTGFFYSKKSNGRNKQFIVTNKHVIKDLIKGTLYFNKIDVKGNVYGNITKITIADFNKKWIFHPDTSIDIAVLSIDSLVASNNKLGINLAIRSITEANIPSDSIWNTFSILEDIIMIGYPIGLRDYINNTPIARTGVTATIPKLDYQGLNEFLIDIAAYNGSSGSPVFLKRVKYGLKKANQNVMSLGNTLDYYFVGVLYAGPVYSPQSGSLSYQIIEEEPTSKNDSIKIFVNLGKVIKSKVIKYFIDSL